MLKNKNIVIGVTGGIAAYKAVDIVSRLKKYNADIRVIMTKSATEFVKPLTFQTMSQNFVVTDMFGEIPSWDVEHIELAKSADMFLIAPATANVIGKVANGIADDMLTTTIMATISPVIFAPAMNTNMYRNPVMKRNMSILRELGYHFISPSSGRLACGDIGEGKLESPETIVKYVVDFFNRKKDLEGKKIIVTAGPTVERLDPVRYITNNSSGKMGYEIAKAARDRGAEVVLISGPTSLEKPENVEFVEIETTQDIFDEVEKRFEDIDVLIKAAAPLDYRPISYSEQKIKKSDSNLNLELERNVDVVKYFGEIKSKQIIVGFAAESENLIKNAKAKLKNKNLDLIVANDISKKETGFKSDYNQAFLISKSGVIEEIERMTKRELADVILDNIAKTI